MFECEEHGVAGKASVRLDGPFAVRRKGSIAALAYQKGGPIPRSDGVWHTSPRLDSRRSWCGLVGTRCCVWLHPSGVGNNERGFG